MLKIAKKKKVFFSKDGWMGRAGKSCLVKQIQDVLTKDVVLKHNLQSEGDWMDFVSEKTRKTFKVCKCLLQNVHTYIFLLLICMNMNVFYFSS